MNPDLVALAHQREMLGVCFFQSSEQGPTEAANFTGEFQSFLNQT
jgi:hypothetical protein